MILDIDLDYFRLFHRPVQTLDHLLRWAGRPVDFVVEHHHQAYGRWEKLVKQRVITAPHFILHADEHHDMLSEKLPVQFGNFLYFALRHWPQCRVHWLTPAAIDYPDQWLSEENWKAISGRFTSGPNIQRDWPKPDLVSLCTSPGFIDTALAHALLARTKRTG